MTGKIIKGIAGFYYVHDGQGRVYECKAKGVFRNRKIKPLVGDNVEFEILDDREATGNIVSVLERKNSLIRPAVSNMDQALVVFAITEPMPNLNLLDRFLVMMERQQIPAVICFNKIDLSSEEEMEKLRAIYGPAGYEIHFISTYEEAGLKEIHELIRHKTTVLAGLSGVGVLERISFSLMPAWRQAWSAKRSRGEKHYPSLRAVFVEEKHVHDGHAGVQLHVY